MEKTKQPLPRTIDEAIERLLADLPLRDRAAIARMEEKELPDLNQSLGLHVRESFGLWSENKELTRACNVGGGSGNPYLDSPSNVIIKALWKRLQETHVLRAVK